MNNTLTMSEEVSLKEYFQEKFQTLHEKIDDKMKNVNDKLNDITKRLEKIESETEKSRVLDKNADVSKAYSLYNIIITLATVLTASGVIYAIFK